MFSRHIFQNNLFHEVGLKSANAFISIYTVYKLTLQTLYIRDLQLALQLFSSLIFLGKDSEQSSNHCFFSTTAMCIMTYEYIQSLL